MALAQIVNGTAVELDGTDVTLSAGIASFATVMLWSEDERNGHGLYTIVETDIPDGKMPTGSALVFDQEAGTVTRELTLIDAPPPPVPASVTPAQARAQLYDGKLLDAAEAAVAAHPYELVRIYWNHASVFERSNAYIEGIAQELSISDDDLDNLFRAAAVRVF